ncbi:MAG: hypothetical protein ACI8QS_000049 [Planctomycetota bacterium]
MEVYTMTPAASLNSDLTRLSRGASALRMLVEEIDLGAADAADLEPVIEFVEEYLFAFLLPALRDTVGPHLLATGALRALPSRRGPGEDAELFESLEGVRKGLSATGGSTGAVEDARMLAHSLFARVRREQELVEAWEQGFGGADERLNGRLLAAYPDLVFRRALADRLLVKLELSA